MFRYAKRERKRAWGSPPMWSRVTHAAAANGRPCFRRLKEDGENGELPPGRELRYPASISPWYFVRVAEDVDPYRSCRFLYIDGRIWNPPSPEFAFPFTQMNYSDTQGNTFALQNKAPAAQGQHRTTNFDPTRDGNRQRGIYKGAAPPSDAFCSVHFFGARQKSDQQTYYG